MEKDQLNGVYNKKEIKDLISMTKKNFNHNNLS